MSGTRGVSPHLLCLFRCLSQMVDCISKEWPKESIMSDGIIKQPFSDLVRHRHLFAVHRFPDNLHGRSRKRDSTSRKRASGRQREGRGTGCVSLSLSTSKSPTVERGDPGGELAMARAVSGDSAAQPLVLLRSRSGISFNAANMSTCHCFSSAVHSPSVSVIPLCWGPRQVSQWVWRSASMMLLAWQEGQRHTLLAKH